MTVGSINLAKDLTRRRANSGCPTVPPTIAQEKATNVFLRADTPEIKRALDMPNATAVDVFAELRRRKDVFG